MLTTWAYGKRCRPLGCPPSTPPGKMNCSIMWSVFGRKSSIAPTITKWRPTTTLCICLSKENWSLMISSENVHYKKSLKWIIINIYSKRICLYILDRLATILILSDVTILKKRWNTSPNSDRSLRLSLWRQVEVTTGEFWTKSLA